MVTSPEPVLTGLLLLLLFISISLGTIYIQTGSDLTLCNMMCAEPRGVLELYRTCRGKDETLLEHFCELKYIKNNTYRLHLNISSGCWTLPHAQKSDSCAYKIYVYSLTEYLLSSTDIRVLDLVHISNITSSRLGEDIALSIHYSGEESTVTWEMEGTRFPERYWLMDNNRTLIIPGVKRGDAKRRFRVTVNNPINEETQDYQLIDDPNFLKLKEDSVRMEGGGAAPVPVKGVTFFLLWASFLYP